MSTAISTASISHTDSPGDRSNSANHTHSTNPASTTSPASATGHLLSPAELARDLSVPDLTDPTQGPHALQLVVDALTEALAGHWESQVRVHRAHPIVSLDDNYERLGFPADAVTRNVRYTRYVSQTCVLRSHTSALIPPALRQLAAEANDNAAPTDVLLVCPGICYRRDSIDWQHTGTPQQLDLWRLHAKQRMQESDLLEMIGLVVESALPGATWRAEPRDHPYTTRGRQIDVRHEGQWIEIGECGIAAGEVLRHAALAPRWTGLAMGLGLDRLLMLRKGIPDIRLLRSTDPRVASQLRDLEPYRPVSHQPPVRRDLSVVVDADTDTSAEALGDRVRDALGADGDAAETVEVRSRTPYEELPVPARERLGIRPGQQNLLVRLVLRALDRTLTDGEANELRDRVYAELHEGSVSQWAAR